LEWIKVVQDKTSVVGFYGHDYEISASVKTGNFLTRQVILNFSRKTLYHGISNFVWEGRQSGWRQI